MIMLIGCVLVFVGCILIYGSIIVDTFKALLGHDDEEIDDVVIDDVEIDESNE